MRSGPSSTPDLQRQAIPSPQTRDVLSFASGALQRGLIVFDADARVRAYNPAAAELLAAGSALRLSLLRGVPGGAMRLTSSDAAIQARIEQVVHDCASSTRSTSGTQTKRPVRALHVKRHGDTPGLVLHFSATDVAARQLHGEKAAVLCVLCDLERPGRLDHTHLIEMFDLSESSARVAEAYLRADTIKEVSRQLGISGNTVKTHLATVYKRTGCTKQSQLIRLLMALSAP